MQQQGDRVQQQVVAVLPRVVPLQVLDQGADYRLFGAEGLLGGVGPQGGLGMGRSVLVAVLYLQ